MSTTKRVVIEPLTRVEGHGKVTIKLDPAGAVESARLHVVEGGDHSLAVKRSDPLLGSEGWLDAVADFVRPPAG